MKACKPVISEDILKEHGHNSYMHITTQKILKSFVSSSVEVWDCVEQVSFGLYLHHSALISSALLYSKCSKC